MPQIFTVQAQLSHEETVTRELKCESKERAMRLMKMKFPHAESIEFVSGRDLSVEDHVAAKSYKVEAELMRLDKLERDGIHTRNRGIMILLGSVLGTVIFFLSGWIAWITLIGICWGFYEISNGKWMIRRAKKLKRWEMETLEN